MSGTSPDGLLRQLRATTGESEATSLLVELDAAGRIERELRNVSDDAYDALESGRITNADFAGLDTSDAQSSASYKYDSSNNWLERTLDDGAPWLPNADPGNAYVNFDDTDHTGRYDADGRLVEAGDRIIAYDIFGRVAEVRDREGAVCTYHYDALGRRSHEDCDGEETYFAWDGNNLVADRQGAEGDVFVTIHSGGVNTPVARLTGTETPHYLIKGRDRSVRAIVDSDGNVIEAYDYTAYGETQVHVIGEGDDAIATGNRLAYHGHIWDPQTGLYSMRARMYAPKWGRFLTQDPIGAAGGANLYAFVGNSPLDHWDPFGLEETPTSAAFNELVRTNALYAAAYGPPHQRSPTVQDQLFATQSPTNRAKRLDGNNRGLRDRFLQLLANEFTAPEFHTGVGPDGERTVEHVGDKVAPWAQSLADEYKVGRPDNPVGSAGYDHGATNAEGAWTVGSTAISAVTGRLPTTSAVPAQAFKTVKHHIFNKFRGLSPRSQKYRDFFKKHGIEVDNFTVEISEQLHKKFIHRAGHNWTTRWKRWIDENPDAKTEDVYQFGMQLMYEYSILGLPIVPYR